MYSDAVEEETPRNTNATAELLILNLNPRKTSRYGCVQVPRPNYELSQIPYTKLTRRRKINSSHIQYKVASLKHS